MSVYTWRRGYDGSHALTRESVEWTENWNVYGYVQDAAPPWYALMTDRPDLVPGQPHPVVPNAYVEGFDPSQLGTSEGWTVAVKYAIRANDQLDVLPWLRPAKISVEPESVEVPILRKRDGSPWITTAGEPIAGLTRTESRIVFNVRKDVQAVPTWLLSYADSPVNSDAVVVKGVAIAAEHLMLRELRIGDDESEQVNGVNVTYVPLSMTLVYNRNTWKTKVYNRGLYQLTDGKFVPCIDFNLEPTSEPMFLTLAGEMMTYPVDPDAVVILEGWDYDRLPFSILPLS